MTLVLPAAPSKQTGAQKLSLGLGRGLEQGNQMFNEYQQKQQLQAGKEQMNQFGQQYGIPNLGELPPEIQKEFLSKTMQGKNDAIKLQSKGPVGGLSGQPINPEVSQAMNQIVQRFPDANADQLKMMMDESGIPPAYSNSFVENRRRQDERMAASKDKRLESGQKRAEKVLDKADALGQELPILESSVSAMEDAIVNGDQSFWSLDNLAELTGLELFRTAKGGQFKSAAKTYFINDLKTSGARPNMFIEKQLADALTKVGRSQEANQTVLESFKFSNDLKKKWQETVRSLEKHYDESIGYLPGSFSRIVEEQMKPYIEDRQKEYEKKLKELAVQEKKKGKDYGKLSGTMIDVKGPDGQIYEIDQSEVGDLPEGFIIK